MFLLSVKPTDASSFTRDVVHYDTQLFVFLKSSIRSNDERMRLECSDDLLKEVACQSSARNE